MEKEKPSYYAIIPANVRYDSRLKANEKLLYGEITTLSNKTGECWASNSYFSNIYGVSKTSISKWIKNLLDCGYLSVMMIYKENSKEIEKRVLKINSIGIEHKLNTPIEEKLNTPIEEKLKDNNTRFNNTSNNNSLASQKSDFKKNKAGAFKAYKAAIKDGVTNKQIQDGIVAYKQEIARKNTSIEYVRYGSSWFNQRGWEDEYESTVIATKRDTEYERTQREVREVYEQQ